MVSGGSSASWSVTFAASTVTVQSSFGAKFAAGSSVKVVGPPVTLAPCAPLVAQLIVNQLPVTFTASPKVIATLAASATPVAPFAGTVAETAGAGSADGCGSGTPAVKSAALLSVSVAPPPFRRSEVVLLGAGAGPVPSKQLAVVP